MGIDTPNWQRDPHKLAKLLFPGQPASFAAASALYFSQAQIFGNGLGGYFVLVASFVYGCTSALSVGFYGCVYSAFFVLHSVLNHLCLFKAHEGLFSFYDQMWECCCEEHDDACGTVNSEHHGWLMALRLWLSQRIVRMQARLIEERVDAYYDLLIWEALIHTNRPTVLVPSTVLDFGDAPFSIKKPSDVFPGHELLWA